jgi:hypothetical protein
MKIVTSRAFDMLIYLFFKWALPIAFGFQGVRQLACITPIPTISCLGTLGDQGENMLQLAPMWMGPSDNRGK